MGYAGCAATGVSASGCGEATLDGPVDVALSDYPELSEVGGVATIPTSATDFAFPIFVVRMADDTYLAYSSECTHFGCEVELLSFGQGYRCPCHGSEFDIDGSVTSGPAKQDLIQFDVTVANDTLTMSPRDA